MPVRWRRFPGRRRCTLGGAGDDLLLGDAYQGVFTLGVGSPPGWAGGISGTAHGGDDQLNGGSGNDILIGDAVTFTGFKLKVAPAAAATTCCTGTRATTR